MGFTVPTPHSTLELHHLRLPVRLGCEPEERVQTQIVRFEVQIRFLALPSACESDQLENTVCYAKLSDTLRKVCEAQEYKLIERLGWIAYLSIKEQLPSHTQLWIRATKEKPPVPHLEGGASFSLGDWPKELA